MADTASLNNEPRRAFANRDSEVQATTTETVSTRAGADSRAVYKAGLCFHGSVLCTGLGDVLQDFASLENTRGRMTTMNRSADAHFNSVWREATDEGIRALKDEYRRLAEYIEERELGTLRPVARMLRDMSLYYLSGDSSLLDASSTRVVKITDEIVAASDTYSSYAPVALSLTVYAGTYIAGRPLAGPLLDEVISRALGNTSLARGVFEASLHRLRGEDATAADSQPGAEPQATATRVEGSNEEETTLRRRGGG